VLDPPRSRTTSVVTGSSDRSAPTVGAYTLSSRSTGSVSRSHPTGSTSGVNPRAVRPAFTRGTKSAMKISAVTRNTLPPKAAKNEARCSAPIIETSTANCSANAASVGSSAGVPSAANAGSDNARAHVSRTSALASAAPSGDSAMSRVRRA
jgi:hypothetical protein